MRLTGWLFALGAVFFLGIAGIYFYFSRDEIGTTALVMTGALAFLIAFYLLYTSKRLDTLPEDRANAEIDEADPEYGFYSPHSWWPLPVGFAAMLVALGFIFTAWLVVLGMCVLLIALIGWLFEYYRGSFVR
ncbi:MAG: cytochrome c oxidase subunit 4 [Actinobacteria bacterium]|nr:cytochrome c oxidase subunit 4 [Actinomycetota bacterium]